MYGYTTQRTRWLPARTRPARPPFVQRWARDAATMLLEFGPVARRPLALPAQEQRRALRDQARAPAVVCWKSKLGHLAASSPAYAHGDRLLRRSSRAARASRAAASSRSTSSTAAIRWSRKLPPHVESSPLLVVAGASTSAPRTGPSTRSGRATARCAGPTRRSGAVKGGLALTRRQALLRRLRRPGAGDPPDGRPARVVGRRAPAARFGLGGGRFYSTPSVAFGRVYVGSTRRQRLLVRGAQRRSSPGGTETGDYVYSSAAVASSRARSGRPSTSAPTTASSTR